MKKLSGPFRDQPMSPQDRAIYWTEYVIRHKGATHLRSPALHLSWIEVLHLDIIFCFHLVVLILVYTIKKTLGVMRNCIAPQNNNKRKSE